jgi:molybdate transport system ATP-binding protein
MLTQPRLLLLDEPLAALDLARKQEILPYLERMHAELEIPVLCQLAGRIIWWSCRRPCVAGRWPRRWRASTRRSGGRGSGAVFDATVVVRDTEWHLARVDFDGGGTVVRDTGAAGQRVRVRILARDVSIASQRHDDSSIMNLLPATVVAQAEEDHPALALLQLRIGNTMLLARLTRRSVQRLDLAPGRQVWAQIKAAALIG